jgi:hypothetical protein
MVSLNDDEAKNFVSDSNTIFSYLLNMVTDNVMQAEAKRNIDEFYNRYSKLLMYDYEDDQKIKKWCARKRDEQQTKTIDDLYDELKRSLYTGDSNVGPPVNNAKRTVSTIKENLKYYVEEEKIASVKTKEVYFKIGEELFHLRKIVRSKEKFKQLVKECCGYSVSYGYQIIEFFKTCKTFPRLVYTTMSFTKLKHYLKDLVECMERDHDFWQVCDCL